MNRIITISAWGILYVLCLSWIIGCDTPGTAAPGTSTPGTAAPGASTIGTGTETSTSEPASAARLELTLFTRTEDHRLTYFELDDHDQLRFAGGRMASSRAGRLVGTLNAQDRQRLRDIVTQFDLMHAPGRLFAQGLRVTYNARIRFQGTEHLFNCADEDVPGLKELHAALLDIYGRLSARNLPGLK